MCLLGDGLTSAILFFVAVIQAIVVSVTYPGFRDAALVVASEVPAVGTRLDRWFAFGVRYAGSTVFAEGFSVGAAAFSCQTFGSVHWYGET